MLGLAEGDEPPSNLLRPRNHRFGFEGRERDRRLTSQKCARPRSLIARSEATNAIAGPLIATSRLDGNRPPGGRFTFALYLRS